MRGGGAFAPPLPYQTATKGGVRAASLLRTGIFIFLVTFVWLQFHVANLASSESGGGVGSGGGGGGGPSANETAAALLAAVPPPLRKFLTTGTSSLSRNGSLDNGGDLIMSSIDHLREAIALANVKQEILNENKFPPLDPDGIVIVVQVHTRLAYLRHLIVSLGQARGIDRSLLVFSHDVWDRDINELVRSVDFCRVVQIFYPYSIQAHPDTFPGPSSSDCPRDLPRHQAVALGCINANHPDRYGHYREASFTQTKHHWWWKGNRVFLGLEATRHHHGPVLFLEEDHYVAEDFVHTLQLMQAACPYCHIWSLGTYLKTYTYYGDAQRRQSAARGSVRPSWGFQLLPTLYHRAQKAEITPWVSSKHNMGMALNRTTWEKIRACANHFCVYDDYNWDWSLQQTSQSCMQLGQKKIPKGMTTLVLKGPRVFHIGECGQHHRKADCAAASTVAKVQHVLKLARRHLYPARLIVSTIVGSPRRAGSTVQGKPGGKTRKGNGGWGDPRDHQLCLAISANASQEVESYQSAISSTIASL